MSATGVPDDVDTYRRHATELIRYATVLVGPDDVPDVVTDAVLAAFRSPQWRAPRAASPQHRSRQRKHRRRPRPRIHRRAPVVLRRRAAGESVFVALDGSEPAALEGATATFGPAGSGQPGPIESEPPVLTAGPQGVVEHRGGESRTLTTEPMAIALDDGDGRIIVQRRSGSGESQGWTDADTIPLVLAADGTTSPLFGAAVWEGGIVLHDIEVIDGRRLLLYSVQRQFLVPQQANENLFVVDLDTEEGTRVARNIGGWEFGTDRLHLATTGLIVGESGAEASHGIAIYAVPARRPTAVACQRPAISASRISTATAPIAPAVSP